ncbi:MAG: carboxypeptidase-like regulatory domain-containing protein [bacterium]
MNTKTTFFGLQAFFGIFFLFFQIALYAQTDIFKGVVKDEQTLKPIPEVNIQISGTTRGTATDHSGRFSIILEQLPVSLVFSCIGYEDENYKVSELPENTVEFLLMSKAYALNEINITANNYSFLFKNKDYSVLDYELMNGNALLLIFRTLLNKSEMVLLNRSGDTLVISSLPESPPAGLYKDFLSNIHYFSRSDHAYQIFYNKGGNRMDVLYKTTVDSLEKILGSFIFRMSDRLYFQETLANGMGTIVGYYQKGSNRQIIRQYFDEKKSSEWMDDQRFYNRWNGLLASQIPSGEMSAVKFAQSPKLGQYMNQFDERAYQFEFYNMIFPVIKITDNQIAFFNFSRDFIEFLDKEGKILMNVPITFHKESVSESDTLSSVRLSESGWRWGKVILEDEFNHNIYTTYLKNGMVKINQIDLVTGKLKKGTVIPVQYPVKMEVYDGDVYFLNKGVNENWKLAKCSL